MAMMSRRSGVGLAVVNGQLYAVGGFDGTTYLKTIEVFDQVRRQFDRMLYELKVINFWAKMALKLPNML